MTIGSCAEAIREPRQIRKEAAVSGRRSVPQASLIRANARARVRDAAIDGGCTAFFACVSRGFLRGLAPSTSLSSTGAGTDRPLSALPPPDFLRDRRPGPRYAHAAERDRVGPGRARVPPRWRARDGEELDRAAHREGGELPEREGR